MYAGRKGFLMVGSVEYSSSRPGVNPGHVSVFCSPIRNFVLKVSLSAQFIKHWVVAIKCWTDNDLVMD